jgi:hypothetical protein
VVVGGVEGVQHFPAGYPAGGSSMTTTENISLTLLRLRMSHIVDMCSFISEQHSSGSERDISIRLALQYLRQDLGRADVHLARLEYKN